MIFFVEQSNLQHADCVQLILDKLLPSNTDDGNPLEKCDKSIPHRLQKQQFEDRSNAHRT